MATSHNSNASALLEMLKQQGYKAEEKRTTLREYPEPVIEFYKSGQARLRGMGKLSLEYLVYHVSDNGIELFVADSKAEMLEVKNAFNWRTCMTATGKTPNIRIGEQATAFYNQIVKKKPENSSITDNGGVAWDKLSVEDKRISWELEK